MRVGGHELVVKLTERCLAGLVGLVFLYVLSAVVVFDFSTGAWHHSQELHPDGSTIAVGPKPRWPFDEGHQFDLPGGWDYAGDEFVFSLYRPIVQIWFLCTEYAPVPSESTN